MPRRKVELSNFYPYHICARSNNQDWYRIPLQSVYKIYGENLIKTKDRYAIECHCFVLMSNHFHMLISTPKANLSEAMRYFMTETSRAIARFSKRINRIYGARYHWTIIRHPEHFAHTYKYIYRNPVKADLVNSAENYRWSTLKTIDENFNHVLSVPKNGFAEYIPQDFATKLSWINESYGERYETYIQKALKKHEFKICQDRVTGKLPIDFYTLPPKNTPGTY